MRSYYCVNGIHATRVVSDPSNVAINLRGVLARSWRLARVAPFRTPCAARGRTLARNIVSQDRDRARRQVQ